MTGAATATLLFCILTLPYRILLCGLLCYLNFFVLLIYLILFLFILLLPDSLELLVILFLFVLL
jgi:hypothetical protein